MNIYDLVIKNGTLIDPEKTEAGFGHIGIKEGKIAAISNEDIKGNIYIDALGHVVCPGFIDIHAHIDGHEECARLSALQGVTTTIGGNCGAGPANLKKFFEEQEKKGFVINQGQLIGHSISLRKLVGINSPYIPASGEQIKQMCRLAEKAFNQGAIGLSFGIEYAPGTSFEEIMELSNLAAKYQRIIPIHTNVGSPGNLSSIHEAAKICELTGAHVLLSHFVYQYGTGIMTEALDVVDDARSRGLKLSVDSGMYTAFSTFIGSTIYDEDYMKKMNWSYRDLVMATGKYKGQRLDESLYHKVRKCNKNDSAICFTGVEDEIYEALLKDYVMLSSDTGPSPRGVANEGHPQSAGTFPRFFRKMVREQKSLSLIKAVGKCTLLPARALDMKEKGRLSIGCDADIVIFDENTIMDRAEFPNIGEPDRKPEGIDYVIVNGQIVVKDGDIVEGVLPGKVLRCNRVML